MPRKKPRVETKPWTLACSENVCRPKNPSHLQVAAAHLGPFQYETKDEALAQGAHNRYSGESVGISRGLAFEMIEGVARRFNLDQHMVRGAPRFKHVLENLLKVQRLANALAECLESNDDITRHELHNAGTSVERQKQFQSLMQAADVSGLPRMSTDDESSADGSWVIRLKSLAAYAKLTVENAINHRVRGHRDARDKGGNTNLWKEAEGSPWWGLVYDCIHIYDLFKPGKATGTLGGPFHRFVLAVFEYATGREGDAHAKVEDWVRKLVKPTLLERQKEAEVAALDAEWDELALRDPKLRTEKDLRRIDKLSNKVVQLIREREVLWERMFPHVPLYSKKEHRLRERAAKAGE
jgi:hypothetical protein